MTATTRRRVVVAVFALVLLLPVEVVLLQALSTPDSRTAVRAWVTSLDATALEDAAATISSYPFMYRREILRTLDGAGRSKAWRHHLTKYIDAHPDLDSAARVVLEAAIALASPSVFGNATASDREQMQMIAEQTVALLGKEEAEYLFYRLGPRDGKFASAEPLSMRLSNWVRGLVVAMAENVGDCECNIDFGCDGAMTCRSGTSCTIDDDWPACGWFWNQTCNGTCGLASSEG